MFERYDDVRVIISTITRTVIKSKTFPNDLITAVLQYNVYSKSYEKNNQSVRENKKEGKTYEFNARTFQQQILHGFCEYL